mgnify:CR=1 FL=1
MAFERTYCISLGAQRLVLAAWWGNQPTKRKNAFAWTAVFSRRIPPSPPARIVGRFLWSWSYHPAYGFQVVSNLHGRILINVYQNRMTMVFFIPVSDYKLTSIW